MTRRIRVRAAGVELLAELHDTATADALWDVLPVSARAARWGDEIYFQVADVIAELEPGARDVLDVGEIGFWVQGSAVAIFFGPTPASRAGEPRAVTPVNVIGRLLDEPRLLRDVPDGVTVDLDRTS